jgi:hypothetical protein
MTRMTRRKFYRFVLSSVGVPLLVCFLATGALAVNTATWEPSRSLIDTTDYTGLANYWWFANFGNPNAVTGQPMDQFEARNLPSWIHLETRPACIGEDDSCANADTTNRTGFSFEENPAAISSNSTGGQPNFNLLTLPDGTTGRSGQAVDPVSGAGTTAQEVFIRILAGAPDNFRMWVVTDNGSGTNYNQQIRQRVSLRNTTGPPTYIGDSEQVDAEALPNGVRIGQTPVGINGIADAWAFRFTDVGLHDFITVRPTSAAGSFPSFAGIMIVPEPSSAALLMLGAVSCGGWWPRRRRSDRTLRRVG